MVNKALLSRKISKLKGYINELEDARDITWKQYCSNKMEKAFIERYLHLAIEEVFDISNHIISFYGWREPENYRDIFTVLAENNILNPKDIKCFQNMASFRNILVHHYEKVDDETVYSVFKKRLKDFNKFIKHVEVLMTKK